MPKLIQPPLHESKEDNLIYLFHHIHHNSDNHKVHHCGGKHNEVGYEIKHCSCGQHRINKRLATGDTIDVKLDKIKIIVEFTEECPDGGWHLESGQTI